MIFVIGGLASGKRNYVKNEFGYSEGDIADAVLDERPVLYNLQDLVSVRLDETDSLLTALLNKQVVICNEVGSGVVPIDRMERQTREATGRVCVALAEKAEKVVRVYCGIPNIIKE